MPPSMAAHQGGHPSRHFFRLMLSCFHYERKCRPTSAAHTQFSLKFSAHPAEHTHTHTHTHIYIYRIRPSASNRA
jgi:hypothetical protein